MGDETVAIFANESYSQKQKKTKTRVNEILDISDINSEQLIYCDLYILRLETDGVYRPVEHFLRDKSMTRFDLRLLSFFSHPPVHVSSRG